MAAKPKSKKRKIVVRARAPRIGAAPKISSGRAIYTSDSTSPYSKPLTGAYSKRLNTSSASIGASASTSGGAPAGASSGTSGGSTPADQAARKRQLLTQLRGSGGRRLNS